VAHLSWLRNDAGINQPEDFPGKRLRAETMKGRLARQKHVPAEFES